MLCVGLNGLPFGRHCSPFAVFPMCSSQRMCGKSYHVSCVASGHFLGRTRFWDALSESFGPSYCMHTAVLHKTVHAVVV